MKIYGFCMVRDEPDIVRVTVLHHLAQGVDHILLVDNGSSDATREIVRELGRDDRVTAWRDDSEWEQAEMLTELAREAGRRGADWIVPFDIDEFWVAADGRLRDLLAATHESALRAPVVNFVQARSRRVSTPDGLLSMTRRVEQAVGPFERTRELVESRQIAFVEMMYPPKFVSRSSPELEIGTGNHVVSGLSGLWKETDALRCLHAPLRSRAAVEAKAEAGKRMDSAEWAEGLGWHARRFARLQAEGRLDEEWKANAYDRDGRLDVFGMPRQLVVDLTLKDLVEPLLGEATASGPTWPLRKVLARLRG